MAVERQTAQIAKKKLLASDLLSLEKLLEKTIGEKIPNTFFYLKFVCASLFL